MNEEPNILIIEDDESTRKTLTLVLGKKGYATETARTGKEALEKAKKQSFNVALLDIKLSWSGYLTSLLDRRTAAQSGHLDV